MSHIHVVRAYGSQTRIRAVAAAIALWLVVLGVLAARHESLVPHLRDDAGAYVHGKVLEGQHRGIHSDIHGTQDLSGDAGPCALLNTFHQPLSAAIAAPAIVTAVCAIDAWQVRPAALAPVVVAIYRVAPKTSPPTIA